MKNKNLVIVMLALSGALSAQERVLLVPSEDTSEVNRLLGEGWTVKHQTVAAAAAGGGHYFLHISKVYLLFTLAAPTEEALRRVALLNEEKKARVKADFERRRAEFLEKNKK